MNNERKTERQRMWSTWLDELPVAYVLEYDEDRDLLAGELAQLLAEVPRDAAGGATAADLRGDERVRRRGWRMWLDREANELALERAHDREELAARLAGALSVAPERGLWGGWRTVRPRPPAYACSDDELRSRLGAVEGSGGRARRMVLRYLARHALDLVRDGAAHCADSVAAFADLFRSGAAAEPVLSAIAERLGQPAADVRAFLDGEYMHDVELAFDPHADCQRDENCGDEDCPPAIAMRKRAAEKVGAWSPIVLGEEGSGRRHYLDGEPVHCGTTLELQAVEDREDDYGEYSVPSQRAVVVRYEAELARPGSPATLHQHVGGHEFVTSLEPWMRFRWPRRKN